MLALSSESGQLLYDPVDRLLLTSSTILLYTDLDFSFDELIERLLADIASYAHSL